MFCRLTSLRALWLKRQWRLIARTTSWRQRHQTQFLSDWAASHCPTPARFAPVTETSRISPSSTRRDRWTHTEDRPVSESAGDQSLGLQFKMHSMFHRADLIWTIYTLTHELSTERKPLKRAWVSKTQNKVRSFKNFPWGLETFRPT